jgi:hypothetical protein
MRAQLRLLLAGPAALAILIAALLVPSAASAATAPITFDLTMFQECFRGTAAPQATVSLVWRDGQGALKARGTTPSSTYGGYWEFCSSDASESLTPGDQIKADDGTNIRKYTIPNFTIFLDRVTNRATGTGPAHRTPRVCSTFAMFSDYEQCYRVRVGDNGTWSFNPHTDIQGGIYASLVWRSPKGDQLYAPTNAPMLRVTLGKAAFSGETAPRQSLHLVDVTNGGSGYATSNGYGTFSGYLVDSLGHLAPVAVGDHVTAPSLSSDADWIVPDIHAIADKTADLVTGVCGDTGTSSHSVEVTILRHGHYAEGSWEHSAPDGSFTADFNDVSPFGGSFNIRADDRVVVGCEQLTGDFAQMKFIVQ